MNLLTLIAPELVLIAVACGLFLLGASNRASSRRAAPVIALAALAVAFFFTLFQAWGNSGLGFDEWHAIHLTPLSNYIRMLTAGIAVILVLLAWPTNREATGSASMDFGRDAGEFYALMLLSVTGVFLVAGANDIILLFLAIELASIPTYIMVSISRPLPVAQEAGVKYFFLGAMAAAVMLFGFSYLYGTTGMTKLDQIAAAFNNARGGWSEAAAWAPPALTPWQTLAVVMLMAGFAFKIAAVPLHAYAGDVYQGAATPVTAFLAFVPKTSGFVALISLLYAVGGTHWSVPPLVATLLVWVAGFTMTVGNVLGLLQFNVKRVLAYSSIAHTGYMLVGLAALTKAPQLLGTGVIPLTGDEVSRIQTSALGGVLFYLAAYGIMNAGAFGVLMLLPSRTTAYGGPLAVTPAGDEPRSPALPPATPATSAETFEDLAGTGRRHLGLGLAMAVCCFSLIGLPLTVGFLGKLYLIKPALDAGLVALVIVTVINAAISAAYYLRIVATMFLRPAPDHGSATAAPGEAQVSRAGRLPWPITSAVAVSVVATLLFGTFVPAANRLSRRVMDASRLDVAPPQNDAQISRDTRDAQAVPPEAAASAR